MSVHERIARPRRRSPARVFAWPLALAAASLAGLLLGLTGGGWRDLLAWGLLGAAPLTVFAAWLRRDRLSSSPSFRKDSE